MTKYKMVQIPPNVSTHAKSRTAAPDPGEAAAQYLEGVVNQYATQGWEFHRVDTIGVVAHGGCLYFGKPTHETYYVITFKREE